MANMIASAILAVVAIIIVGALLPTVTDFTIGLQGTGNVTGATSTVLGVVPIIFIVGFLVALLVGMKVVSKVS